MAIGTLTESLDNFYTTTWQNMKSDYADNIFAATPFWFWMKKNNRFEQVNGGRWIGVSLRYAKSDKVAWITKGGTVSLSDKEFLTTAKFDWKYLVDSIVRFGVDDQQNRGKNAIMSLAEAKMANSKDSLVDTLETALFAAASGNTMNGLQDLVADAGTGIVGGIDSSTYTWFQNQKTNMTGKSFGTYGVSYMRTMLNNCANNLNQDRPDIIVTGQTAYEYYEDDLLEYKRIMNNDLADAGFENIQFKGVPMIWSPSCSTRMYFLNTRFLKFVYDPAMFFDMTEWKPIPDQVNDRAAQVITACELTVSRRRCQGVIYNIDTE